MDNIKSEAIPQKLKKYPNWVNWKIETREGKPTKPPINPHTGGYAESNNPSTWGTYEEAVHFWKKCENGTIEGIGFMFTDGHIGIDLDKCRNPKTGEIDQWAKEIIDRINSYSEISPSGAGIHTIASGTLPSGQRKKGKIEMYDRGRYFTVTGWHLEGTPFEIQQRDAELREVHSKYLSNGKKSPSSSQGNINPSSSDLEIIEKAKYASNGDKFQKLWSGNWSEYPSQSEADLALCQILAFWIGREPGKIDTLFRQSALMRKKWNEKHSGDGATYGEKTIQMAIERTIEVYRPPTDNTQGRNLTEQFRMWLNDCYGAFTIEQIYKDLTVTSLNDKNLIRVNLKREAERGVIEKGQVMGAYRKVDQEADRLEILETDPIPLSIKIPGELENHAQIYQGNIIVNAGSPNAGKTAFDLNFAYENRDRYEVCYWSSEMGSEELSIRTKKFDHPIEEWRKIDFRKRTHDFHQIINPDAVNVIDYLEVIEGKFYEIGDSIRRIFEKLGKGIALVSLQMDTGGRYAWGGQKTLDKARLYVTLDKNRMVVVKVKNRATSGLNPNGLSRPFKLINGSKFLWEPWERAW